MNSPRYPCILYSTRDPYTNLALEEALLNSVAEGIMPYERLVRIWVNPTSIILGRFSDPFQEVDIEKAASMGIPITRRLTGGRAVFHDAGNLNISLYKRVNQYKPVNVGEIYREGLNLVTGIIKRLGYEASIANGNDVVVRGYKVSGSAALASKGSALFHGTLLVDSDMRLLEDVILKPRDPTLGGRVDPVKFRPMNLSSLLGGDVSISDVEDLLVEMFCEETLSSSELPSNVVSRAYRLSECRYMNSSWIYRRERISC